MTEVFISYAHQDREVAAALATKLASRGYSVWWDHELVGGAQFRDVIVSQLRQAKHVLVIWSLQSVGSKWVIDEAEEAQVLGKLIPIKTRGLPVSLIPFGFRQAQTVELDNFDTIVRAIRSRIAQQGVIGEKGFLAMTSTATSSIGALVNRYSYEYGLHIAICFIAVPVVIELLQMFRPFTSYGIWGLIVLFFASLGWTNFLAGMFRRKYDHGIFLGLIIVSLMLFAFYTVMPESGVWEFYTKNYFNGLFAYVISGLCAWLFYFLRTIRLALMRK